MAGIKKRVTPHTLRHSFATHLLQQDVDICVSAWNILHAGSHPDTILLPGMYAEVEITGAASLAIAVPESAVIDTGTRQIVILDEGEGRFEPRDVKIGTHGDGFTEIRNGIAPGDRIVTAANFLIDAESNLKAALAGMSAVEATP